MTVIKKILVATDFSKTSTKAVEYAKTIAKSLNAQLDVVVVIDPSVLDFGVTHFTIGGVSKWAEKYQAQKDDVDKKLQELKLEVKGEKFTLDGNPGKTIVKYLEEDGSYDLIVLGSHGYGNLDRFVLGSVSEHVTRYAPCPVMVIKKDS